MNAGEKEAEFLVKYQGKAHVHNEWVPESLLLRIAKRKCINFKRRHEEPVDLMDPAWTIPQRLVARRCAPTGPGWEVLVKWCGQGYEACTWEVSPLAPRHLMQCGEPACMSDLHGTWAASDGQMGFHALSMHGKEELHTDLAY